MFGYYYYAYYYALSGFIASRTLGYVLYTINAEIPKNPKKPIIRNISRMPILLNQDSSTSNNKKYNIINGIETNIIAFLSIMVNNIYGGI